MHSYIERDALGENVMRSCPPTKVDQDHVNFKGEKIRSCIKFALSSLIILIIYYTYLYEFMSFNRSVQRKGEQGKRGR